jgi:hypothetical protein
MRGFAWKSGFVPAVVFAAGLAAAVPMLPTTVSFEDSAEFTAAAATFGIPHPSGYPLYALYAGMFTALPVGTVPWRVALASAVAAAGALAVLFAAARRLARSDGPLTLRHEIAVALVILTLAAGEVWWSQAVTAEVYSLHAFFVALLAYALVRIGEGSGRWFLAAPFIFGLSMANHLFLTAATLPFFVFAAWLARRRFTVADACRAAALFVIGLLPYLLLVVRAESPAAFRFGVHDGLRDLLAHVFRSGYQDVGTDGWNKAGILGSVAARYLSELGPLALALAIVGFWRLPARSRAAAAWLAGVVVSIGLIVWQHQIDWSPQAEYAYRVFMMPGLAAVVVAAAVGAALLLRRGEAAGRTWTAVALFVAVAAVAVSSFADAAPRVAAARDGFVDRYARALLEPLPPDAVLLVNDPSIVHDTEIFALAYVQMVEGLRPDVSLVSDVQVTPFVRPELPERYGAFDLPLRRRMLVEAVMSDPRLSARPLFATFPPEASVPGVTSDATGVLFRIRSSGEAEGEPVTPVDVAPPPDALVAGHYALRSLVSHMLYNKAAHLAERHGNQAALPAILKAIALDPLPMSADYQAFVAHRQMQ